MDADPLVDLLVVGSGPAAVAATRAYREHGGPGRVLMLSADPDEPYERPPLSKDFLRGSTSSPTPIEFPGDVDRQVASVTHLDPAAHLVRTTDGSTFAYRRCVLATGSVCSRLPVPGGDDPSLLTLRSLGDARALRSAASSASSASSSGAGGGAGTAVVVGSGFIGCEAAVSLARLGLSVTQVSDESLPQASRLGASAASRLAAWLRAEKVSLVSSAVSSFEGGRVLLEDGRSVTGDVVLLAVGVSPASALADSLAVSGGRIKVDSRMRTSAPDVFACGDVALAFNAAAGRALAVEHWGEALAMGSVAGAVAAGAPDVEWAEAPGFWSEIGDRTLKYVAWGDGFDSDELVSHEDGGFTVWYTDKAGVVVGVLTHEADEDYERGREFVEQGRTR